MKIHLKVRQNSQPQQPSLLTPPETVDKENKDWFEGTKK